MDDKYFNELRLFQAKIRSEWNTDLSGSKSILDGRQIPKIAGVVYRHIFSNP
jgi:hypothetical protein